MKCTICANKARKKIDAAVVLTGATICGVAAQFQVSDDSLRRHIKHGHVLQRIAKAQNAQDIVEADNLLQEIQEIHNYQKDIFNEERANANNRLALEALRDQSRIVELKGKVLGSFVKDKPESINPIQHIPDEEVERRARQIFAKRNL